MHAKLICNTGLWLLHLLVSPFTCYKICGTRVRSSMQPYVGVDGYSLTREFGEVLADLYWFQKWQKSGNSHSNVRGIDGKTVVAFSQSCLGLGRRCKSEITGLWRAPSVDQTKTNNALASGHGTSRHAFTSRFLRAGLPPDLSCGSFLRNSAMKDEVSKL